MRPSIHIGPELSAVAYPVVTVGSRGSPGSRTAAHPVRFSVVLRRRSSRGVSWNGRGLGLVLRELVRSSPR